MSELVHAERQEEGGSSELGSPLLDIVIFHQGQLTDEAGQGQCLHAGIDTLSVSAQKMVGDGNVDIKFEDFQDAGFHGEHLISLINVIADIQDVIHTRWAALLWVERRGSHKQAKTTHSSLLGDERQGKRG